MPNWNEILREIAAISEENTQRLQSKNPFDIVRRSWLAKLSQYTGRNTIIYYSGWQQKGHLAQFGTRFDIHDGDKPGFMSTIQDIDRARGLDLFLHTPGGVLAATESLVHYLRQMFGTDVRAIIPQTAMSAGTMIACSCKEIVMGKHSNLGPIDPQLANGTPTHGILEEFENAKSELLKNPDTYVYWQSILSKYHPTLIGECQKAVEWTEELVTEWLATNMFRTESIPEQAVAKARLIVDAIGSHKTTFSHDRHLHKDYLATSLGMKIVNLEDDQILQDLVLSVHHSAIITLSETDVTKIIENQNGRAYLQHSTTSPQ